MYPDDQALLNQGMAMIEALYQSSITAAVFTRKPARKRARAVKTGLRSGR
jgi:hypothetical protein